MKEVYFVVASSKSTSEFRFLGKTDGVGLNYQLAKPVSGVVDVAFFLTEQGALDALDSLPRREAKLCEVILVEIIRLWPHLDESFEPVNPVSHNPSEHI